MHPRAPGFLALSAAMAVAGRAAATPQASVGATVGGAITNVRAQAKGSFELGARADLLFLRERESDLAVGPYVELMTERLNSLEVGGGAEWLLPALPSFPLVASGGVFARRAPLSSWQPGIAAGLFLGPRSHNFHSRYAMANGVFAQGRFGLGEAKQADVIVGLQIDLAILALPLVFAYEGLAH